MSTFEDFEFDFDDIIEEEPAPVNNIEITVDDTTIIDYKGSKIPLPTYRLNEYKMCYQQ